MSALLLILLLGYASTSDCLTHRIPNWLCLFGLVAGVALQLASAGIPGIPALLASVLVPFLVFIPFYMAGGMAAGDVKLMVACGALLGWPLALFATGLALVAGTVMGVGVYIYRGGWAGFTDRYFGALKFLCLTGATFMTPTRDDPVASSRFPYALAIAVGSMASLALMTPL